MYFAASFTNYLNNQLKIGGKTILQAAREGAAATVSMKAKAGRASYVHTSRLVNPDPGAQAVALWMEAIYNSLKRCLDSAL